MKKKAVVLISAFLLMSGASLLLCTESPVSELPGSGDYVVLLHGLGRTSSSMNTMAEHLRAKGFHVINIDYPSRDHDIATLAIRYVAPLIEERCTDATRKIHFVTHSLGGILVRYYLRENMSRRIGTVVMLAPPNQGSEVADFLTQAAPVRKLMGPALSQLGTHRDSMPNSLGPAPCEVGIITGNVSFNWINSLIIPGPDDGKVAVARAPLAGMKSFLLVKRSHIFIMKAPEVMAATASFLKTGHFNQKGESGRSP